jgi:hypothetical protein
VWGAAAIGRLIGLSERKAYHLLETHALRGAARKIRGKWTAIPSKLLALWASDAGGDA